MADTKQVIQVAVPEPHSVYDCHVDAERPIPEVGARLRVPFGRSEVIGICISTEVDNPHTSTKAVIEVLDTETAIAELLALAQWMQRYYHYPLGEVLATVLPSAARRGTALEIKPEAPPDLWQTPTLFRPERTQQAVVDHLAHVGDAQTGEALEAAGFNRSMLRKLEGMSVLIRKAAPLSAK